MKTAFPRTLLAASIAALLSACSSGPPPAETPRTVRTVAVRYGQSAETHRYVGTVQARREVDQGFRVGGKVAQRRVDVGQAVREGDVLAVLDDTDYRLAEEAARQQLIAARAQARQAESDRQRLAALKQDGSVSVSDEEKAQSQAVTSQAAAEAESRKLELARNRLVYTVLRASRGGVVTAIRFEVGQVVAEGQPVVSIADHGDPEIVVDVPEDHLARFKAARFRASLASAPAESFEVSLRELAPQAVPQTRTYRARLKPADARRLPLGATATLRADGQPSATPAAAVPASAITQSGGQPAVWIARNKGDEPRGTVELVPVAVHAYRNDEALVSGPAEGALVVTAGVQKMAPGMHVVLSASSENAKKTHQAAR